MSHLQKFSISSPLVIGLTGTNAAGKGTIADYFTKHSFTFFSLSDVLRDQLKQKKLEDSRENLTQMGITLRQHHGTHVLAKLTIEKMKNMPKVAFIIDSFRHPSEVELFKQIYGKFTLLAVDAPAQIRYDRALSRGRNENASCLQEFIQAEEKESSSNLKAQQLQATLKIADHTIVNDGNIELLNQTLDKLYLQLSSS